MCDSDRILIIIIPKSQPGEWCGGNDDECGKRGTIWLSYMVGEASMSKIIKTGWSAVVAERGREERSGGCAVDGMEDVEEDVWSYKQVW